MDEHNKLYVYCYSGTLTGLVHQHTAISVDHIPVDNGG